MKATEKNLSCNTNNIISTKEAAAELDVKINTINKYVKEGKLKPVYKENWSIDTTKILCN